MNDMKQQLEIFYLVTVDAPVFMAANDYTFSEGSLHIATEVCVGIMPPSEGLEIELTATFDVTDGFKAGISITIMSSVRGILY